MSSWICCNGCFSPPGAERKLAVTTCGHVVCNVCFQKGKQGECLICKAKCRLSPLSDKSSSEVKALFSDINTVTTKCFSEISKVLLFQARHQKRLLTHYQQRSEKFEEMLQKMKQEMQQMSKKVTEQNAYISQLETTLQHQSARAASQSNRSSHATCLSKPASSLTQIPYSSPVSLSQHLSMPSLVENMEVDTRGLYRKPEISGSIPRLSLISPPQDGRMGTVVHRPTSQSTISNHSARSATVSRDFSSSVKHSGMVQSPSLSYLREKDSGMVQSPSLSYRREKDSGMVQSPSLSYRREKDSGMVQSPSLSYHRDSGWETPVFKIPSAYRYPSMSCLGPPP